MDEQLAAIYGTNQETYTEEDMQKTAAAELLVKLAEEEGVDLNDFSDEEVADMISELYGEEQEKTAEPTDEDQEKLAEADFLGRVMAHAYTQELNKIAAGEDELANPRKKTFGERETPKKFTEAKVKKLEESRAKVPEGEMPGKARRIFETAKAYAKRGGREYGHAMAGGRGAKGVRERLLGAAGQRGRVWGARGGTAAAALLAEEGLRRGLGGHKKHGSGLETLVEQRAFEMAAEAGWVDNEGNLLAPGQEKQASDVERTIEVEALKLLEANGYPVTWNE
jgi:hypothetical protein